MALHKYILASSLLFQFETVIAAPLCRDVFTPPKTLSPAAADFTQVEASKNASQLLRSNAPHFWARSHDTKLLKDLVNYIDAEGTISGDMHSGNMTVIPAKDKTGKMSLKFLNVDFDDGGKGSFALEFARFAAIAKASSAEIKIKDMFDAYLSGLRGISIEKPTSIIEAESMTFQKYEDMRTAYVAKKTLDGKFKFKDGEIESWDGRPNITDVQFLFKGSKVLDIAKRPVERGGSANVGVRLWVLSQDKNGSQHITELKPYTDTALTEYTRQDDPTVRVKNLHETYWQGLDPNAYVIADVLGTTYWVREKKVTVLEYKDLKEEDQARIYIANIIGRTQSLQPAGPALLRKIEQDPDRFREAIKQLTREYLKLANEAMM